MKTPFRRWLTAALAGALLAVAPALAAAVVSNGHSGWSWSDPSPQGEGILDLSFTGATGYAVGGFGTILRTTDSGQTWTGLPSLTTQDLTRVGVVGSAGFVAAGPCAVRRSGDAGATILPIDIGGGEGGCTSPASAVAFADDANGLIGFGNGVILATTDGGASLTRRTPLPGAPTDMVATSPTTAFATVGDAVYRTSDGASSWTIVGRSTNRQRGPFPVPALPGPGLLSITFASPNVGYAVGGAGNVLKTTDGGATWTLAADAGAVITLARVRCASESLCIFTTAAGTSIMRTTDGATTYQEVIPAPRPIRAVAFASTTRAIAAGDGGVTVVSDDGGTTWSPVSRSIASSLVGVAGRPGGFGFAVGENTIAATLDGGETWRTFGIPSPLPIHAATFADPRTGFAQASGGTLWRTSNGGASWQVLDPGEATGLLQRIVPLSRGRLLILTATRVARSTDDGDSFSLVDDPVLRRSGVVRTLVQAVGGGSRAFIVGRTGIVTSADAGRRWSRLPLPRTATGRAPRIAVADCATPATCWIVTTGSRMYRTANLGRTWVEVTPSFGVPMRQVRRIATGGPGEVLVALAGPATPGGPSGLVMRTGDNGRTWAPQLLSDTPLAAIDALPGRAWALTSASELFTSPTGGTTGIPSQLSIRSSTRTFRRAARVTVTGRLPGAQGGEQVTLYASGLRPRNVTVSSGGTFTAVYRLARTTTFVAQWAGDGIRDGDGTAPLVVSRARR